MARWPRGPVSCLLLRLFLALEGATICAEALHHKVSLEIKQVGQESPTCAFVQLLELRMKSRSPFRGSVILDRKQEVDTDAPAYSARTGPDGAVVFARIGQETGGKRAAAYQGSEYGAAFLARCSGGKLVLEGSLYIDGKKYRVKPTPDPTTLTPDVGQLQQPVYLFTEVKDELHYDRALVERMRKKHAGFIPAVPQQRTASNEDATRHKRDTKHYYIDVLVALDYVFFQFWVAQAGGDTASALTLAKEYIAYIFNGINSRFNTINTLPYKLRITLSGFLIAETADAAPWTETVKERKADGSYQVNANTVLEQLEQYVRSNWNNLPVSDSDHVMLFTEYDLFGEDNGFRFNNTAGLALIGTMCYTDGRSVSVVEDHGGYQCENTVAHEIGHSLGAQHDGTGNECDSADRYVMSGGAHPETSGNKRNPWRFSPCSVQYFADHIQAMVTQGFEDSCLLNRSTAEGVPEVSGLPGQRSGPDEQCRQIYGSQSYLCRGASFGQPEDVCLSMFCRNPATLSSCTLNTAAPGTCCGNGKWCMNGECVASASADCYMSDTCPFGQREGVVFQGFTCDEMPSGNCYDRNFRQVCCQTCDERLVNISGCEFGDRVLQCNASYCGWRYENGDLYDVNCCGTCNYAPPTTTTVTPPSTTTATATATTTTTTTTAPEPPVVDACQDVAIVNGTSCANFLEENGLLYCCTDQMQRACCRTCRDRKSTDASCPYGDCDPGCDILNRQTRPCDTIQRGKCCLTCQQLETSASTAPPSATITTTTTTTTTTSTPAKADDCKPILGVRTCGSWRAGGAPSLLLLMAFLSWERLFL